MPSLPELEVYRTDLTGRLVGHEVKSVEALDFRVVRVDLKALEAHLAGHPIAGIRRYGKWLTFDIGGTEQILIHLGLTGKLSLIDPSTKLPGYSVFVFKLDDGRRLVLADARKLGRIYLRNFDEIKAEKELGPDLFSIKEDYFTGSLRRKRRGARDVLMDQKIIAGIGGKYADEILWQAKLHPNTKLDRLDPTRLAELYQITMRVNREAVALDADVERFPQAWLIPHRRTDKICPRCGSPLTERTLGGSATFYCPNDQPAPNPFRSG
jgi:formamidopyrimidine-DNA glycosylase